MRRENMQCYNGHCSCWTINLFTAALCLNAGGSMSTVTDTINNHRIKAILMYGLILFV